MTKKILVVEDDSILQKAISYALKEENFDVLQATDGKEALEKIKKNKLDLVLLDLLLPEIPGEQVLKTMHEDSKLKKIPVIVLSCKGNKAVIDNCVKNLGAKHYFHKGNYSLEEIVNKIKEILLQNNK